MSIFKRLAFSFFLACFSIIAAFAAGEIFCRALRADILLMRPLLRHMPEHPANHRASDNDELMYELIPNSHGEYDNSGKKLIIDVNSLGFRDKERSVVKPKGTLRIICVGASTLYGPIVNANETYPYYLEKLLTEQLKRPVEVWNMGICGAVMRQHVERARIAIEKFNPDAIIFYQSNMGRRSMLSTKPFGRFFRDSPELFSENVHYIFFRGKPWGMPLFYESCLWRTLTIAVNYCIMFPQNNQDFDDDKPNIAAYKNFVKTYGKRVPIFLVSFLDNLSYNCPNSRFVSLYLPPNVPPHAPFYYYDIHPAPWVYQWYAKILGREIIASGVLEKNRHA